MNDATAPNPPEPLGMSIAPMANVATIARFVRHAS
jgi:hypothetical protein